jgi:uncharacterized membrane protein YoaK (UPF0700 family)
MLWLGLVAGAIGGAVMFPLFGLMSLLLPAVLLGVLALLVRGLDLES